MQVSEVARGVVYLIILSHGGIIHVCSASYNTHSLLFSQSVQVDVNTWHIVSFVCLLQTQILDW